MSEQPYASNTPVDNARGTKFLVVVDDSPEYRKAIYWACRRAQRTNGSLVLLAVIEPPEQQHWMAIGEAIRAEAWEEADIKLDEVAADIRDSFGVEPECVVREGRFDQAIMSLMEEDKAIRLLVLGTSTDPEGPGPLVEKLAVEHSSRLPAPVTLIPGNMSWADIDQIT